MRARIVAIAGGIAVLLVMVAVRVVQLTVNEGADLTDLARQQHQEQIHVAAQRGAILDRRGDTLASSVERPSIFVRPRRVTDPVRAQQGLPAALDLRPATVAAKLSSPAPFVWVKRAVTPSELDAVQTLGIDGIGEVTEARRFYPHGSAAAQILGSAGTDMKGLDGVELYYERDLRPLPRTLSIERDARGREIRTEGVEDPRVLDGATVQLTLDTDLQILTEHALEQGVREAGARAGTAIVLDPWTGEVLALANSPTFNPNERSTVNVSRRRNPAVSDFYEPGSTFKAFVVAAAIEHGLVRPDEMLFCEHGKMPVGKWVIHDHDPYGWLSVTEVIQFSSNIGAAKIGERLGSTRLHAFLSALGLGRPTGVDLPAEAGGILRPVGALSRIALMTTSFGQGVAVTPIQMAQAYAAIANGGLLIKPYVGMRAVSADGHTLWERQPTVVRRVMRPETARTVTAMLEKVTENGGTGTRARLDGVRIAGKTGTAQKVEPGSGRYSRTGRIASFVGFLPAEAPRFVILVLVDEPTTASYGGIVAAPIFRTIAAGAMQRAGMAPCEPPSGLQTAAIEAPPASGPEPFFEGVPSFLGMSKRAALARARDLGWLVQVDGEGYVAEQVPPPGAAAAPGKWLVLSLRPTGDVL